MPRHLEQVLAHAENQLAATGATRPTEVLPLYKKFLKIEEHRLRLKHQAGGGGREICALRVDLIDVLLRHVFNAASASALSADTSHRPVSLALIGLGGYGRRELNPFSDVDVMVLHGGSSGSVSPYIEQVVEQILYLLWDIGFKVGHSTRSIKEALAQANQDMLTKTAMLESRFIAGDALMAKSFRDQFRTKCVVGYEREYVEMRMQDQISRHKKYGDSVYVQEPNLKNGCGGLRDYQNLLWLTYFKEAALTTTHLVGRNWLSESDQRRIDVAYDFLLRLRSDLHYTTGRASDVLYFNVQEQLARRLGYQPHDGQLRSEVLMRDFYQHTRHIFRVTERITEQFRTGQASAGLRSLFGFLPSGRRSKIQHLESFFVRDQKLHPEKRDIFDKDPVQMMRLFELAQKNNWGLSPQLEDLISRRLGQINKVYQYAKVPREIFMSILSNKGDVGRILRMMHGVDFLGRYIPEFGQLTCLVQHEFFHRYTADEHTLVCIDKLDALMRTDEPKFISYRKLFEKLEDPRVLYLALLLHDTGRAVRARPHSEASALFANRVASRLQLSSEQRRSLVLLVDHHVTLSSIAQQRNLDDPATITEFAGIVKNQKNLDALMLLTLADGQGTSAAAWSDWKESLVWQLYQGTSQYLSDQGSYLERTRIERDALQEAVLKDLSPDYGEEVEAHFEYMPDNYFRASKPSEIVRHLKLFRAFFENATGGDCPLVPAIEWEPVSAEGNTIVRLCNWHREQLLAKIAGSFAVQKINILSVDTYTRGDGAVLDILRVCDANGQAVSDRRIIEPVEQTLRDSLEKEEFNFKPLIAKALSQTLPHAAHGIEFPTHIAIDNRAHPTFTLIQIQTPDRIGLLNDLLSCFGNESVSIALSRISTQTGAAIDTFYVLDATTRAKITDSGRMSALQQRLHTATLGEK